MSTAINIHVSAFLDGIPDLAIALRVELAFLGTFAAIWLSSRLLGVRLDDLLGLRRTAAKPAPLTPAARALPEGPAAARKPTTAPRRNSRDVDGGVPAVGLGDLHNPSAARLADAHWVLSAAQQLARAQDPQRSLDLYRKARRGAMNLKTLSLAEGRQLFMLMVTSAIRLGRMSEALALLKDCREEGLGISLALLTSATKLATANQLFKDCLSVYEYVAEDAELVIDERCVWSCLLFCAVESRSYAHARPFWEALKKCGEATYKDFGNMMRYASTQMDWQLALLLLQEMRDANMEVERVIYNTALSICVTATHFEEAVGLLADMEKVDGFADVITYNTLAKGYAKDGQLDACFELCGRLRSKGLEPSQVTYGILLDCCINQSRMDRAREVFDHMMQEGCAMNTVLYTTMIKGFARSEQVDEAMAIYERMRSDASGNVSPDVITFSILVKANCDAGRQKTAMGLLEAMMELRLAPDEVIFNNLIGGCVHEANTGLAKRLYHNMVEGGIKPSTATFSILIRLYASCKMMDEAVGLLTTEPAAQGVEAAPRLYLQLMQCCLRDRQGRRAIEVYKMMPTSPTALMHGQLLGTCGKLNMLETGAELLGLAAARRGQVARADAEQLRDIALRKKKILCADMITEAMGRLRLASA